MSQCNGIFHAMRRNFNAWMKYKHKWAKNENTTPGLKSCMLLFVFFFSYCGLLTYSKTHRCVSSGLLAANVVFVFVHMNMIFFPALCNLFVMILFCFVSLSHIQICSMKHILRLLFAFSTQIKARAEFSSTCFSDFICSDNARTIIDPYLMHSLSVLPSLSFVRPICASFILSLSSLSLS